MNIITLLRWSVGHGNRVVPSRWQATRPVAPALPSREARVGRIGSVPFCDGVVIVGVCAIHGWDA